MTPPGSATVSRRQLLERHRHVQDEQLRYLQKLGFIQAIRVHGEPHYSFADLTVIRQADTELAEGISFRAVVRNLLASRAGQLAFDFRGEARPAKVLQLTRREPPPFAVLMNLTPPVDVSSAEQHFLDGSRADDGDPEHFDDAMHSYRRALELDPYMVIPGHNPPVVLR